MKSSFFKKLAVCLLVITTIIPVCHGQNSNENQQVKQNTEVLGENDRLPFMHTEDSVTNNEPSSGGLLVKTFGAMFLIVGLIFFGAWGLKKFGFGNSKANSAEDTPDLKVISSVSMGSGRTISTVRFGEKILLVGSTAQSFTLLADESENETPVNSSPRSVAEMLAEEQEEEENSFIAHFEQAEMNLAAWDAKGENV